MAHRIGVCRSCRVRFQIPASFAPNRAKCRSCGGVVAIGPVEGEPEASAPAAEIPPPAPPEPPPEPVRAPPEPAPAPQKKRGIVGALRRLFG